jgi:hypothetical protein
MLLIDQHSHLGKRPREYGHLAHSSLSLLWKGVHLLRSMQACEPMG